MTKFQKGHKINNGRKHSELTKLKNSLAHLGKSTWNKGMKGYKNKGSFKKGVVPPTAFKKGLIPWNKGLKTGIAWNRGLTKETDSRVLQASNSLKKYFSVEENKHMKGRKHTLESREKIRLARLKQVLPKIDTSIERKVKEQLDYGKIEYIHPFNLGNKFQCDFFIPKLNLIIECDGSHWHDFPDKKRNDISKDAYIKACGMNILRLRDFLINKEGFNVIGYLNLIASSEKLGIPIPMLINRKKAFDSFSKEVK